MATELFFLTDLDITNFIIIKSGGFTKAFLREITLSPKKTLIMTLFFESQFFYVTYGMPLNNVAL